MNYLKNNSARQGCTVPAQLPRALTVIEVAELLHTTKAGVYALIHSNQLTSIRIGRQFRITTQALNEFLKLV